ncbi:MAG: arginyltransferase [Acidiferrobacterales bacterium]
MTATQKKPDLYLSMPHPCSYLADRTSTIVFVDPRQALDTIRYGDFVRQGFRRSGELIYKPNCLGCAACTPVRIPVQRFLPSRGQRRIWKKNADIRVTIRPAVFSPEHFSLYRHYQAGRHPGSSMDDPDPEKYIGFLRSPHTETVFCELRTTRPAGNRSVSQPRSEGTLLGVAVTDVLPDALSAVYTFYDPNELARGLGVHAILWQISEAQRRGLSWVYLGYWIGQSPKMAYKTNFRPLEALRDARWETVTGDVP